MSYCLNLNSGRETAGEGCEGKRLSRSLVCFSQFFPVIKRRGTVGILFSFYVFVFLGWWFDWYWCRGSTSSKGKSISFARFWRKDPVLVSILHQSGVLITTLGSAWYQFECVWHLLVSEIDEYYADVRYERIAILNALGAYYSYLGKIETKQREKEEHFILATQYYNKASRIDMHESSTWVGKGNHDSDNLYGVVCWIYMDVLIPELLQAPKVRSFMPLKLIILFLDHLYPRKERLRWIFPIEEAESMVELMVKPNTLDSKVS